MAKGEGSQKRTWKRIAKKDRRNLKLWAEGAREEILKPHIAAYTDALERGWRAERDYLQLVCNEYHARVPWRMEDWEEPDLSTEYDPCAVPTREDLPPEDLVKKRVRIDTMNATLYYFSSSSLVAPPPQRIARWLKYRAHRLKRPIKMDRTRDPWAILLAKLAGINSPPKARQAFQQYMHESYDADIGPAVMARWAATHVEEDGGELQSKKGPDAPFRAQVARELFNELPVEEQDGLCARARDEAKEAREQYIKAMKGGPSKDPADRQRCIDNLGPFMTAILRGVTEYTGFAVFGGPMPQYGGEIRTFQYLHTAFTPEECAEAALPGQEDGEDPLARAQYTIDDDGDLGFKSNAMDLGDSSSDSSGSSLESDSDIDSDIQKDVAQTKKKGNAKKETEKARGKVPPKTKAQPKRKAPAKRKHLAVESGESGSSKTACDVEDTEEEEEDGAKQNKRRRRATAKGKEKEQETEVGEEGGSKTARPYPKPRPLVHVPVQPQLMSTPPGSSQAAASMPPPPCVSPLAPPPPPPRVSPPPQPSDGPVPVCPDDAVEWFCTVYPEVTAKPLGGSFNSLFAMFIDIERAHKWKPGVHGKSISTSKRPGEVGSWIGSGRGSRGGPQAGGAGPAIESATKFAAAWWLWSGVLQPPWRAKDEEHPGRFKRDTYPRLVWSRRSTGGGKKVASRGEHEAWLEAVIDTKWMFEGMLASQLATS
ncbi:hypothetical protein C8R43DRAFT_1131860 [Mycena crocata]|nr:hypothetical protein C8R43DRAFT_1131860 [Mycena crocata]